MLALRKRRMASAHPFLRGGFQAVLLRGSNVGVHRARVVAQLAGRTLAIAGAIGLQSPGTATKCCSV